uniref:Glycosyl transferase family 1 domain-containing protein n=1 Tax=Strombidium rassoulzadegani TaxID=1082188 RepID=A0A7S3FWG5_9SPIT|mmetsp:Transcript_18404/g.31472  ORF Transcript_18404/g.31472 Transcript_18404/m.31472 type:complete len:134 (+) Transcript_18404:229-630(+)
MARDLKIQDNVSFEINASRNQLFDIFQRAKVAIHTMKDEHFGIAIVELMSSGIITVAHDSAGPRSDIIGPSPKPVGYLAQNQSDYCEFVKKALINYDQAEHVEMRRNARHWVRDQFGLATFDSKFVNQLKQLL